MIVDAKRCTINLIVGIPLLTREPVTSDAGFYWLVVTPSMNNLSGYPADSKFNLYGTEVGESFVLTMLI